MHTARSGDTCSTSDEVTRDFRVIAYDLPYHGKSLPPEGKAWWAEEYRLTKSPS